MTAPSIVLIWNNNAVLNLRSHKVTGHASMNIGNEWRRHEAPERLGLLQARSPSRTAASREMTADRHHLL
ncbi:MAG TPA: hypothetical protein VF765_02080 [Polyangiaceae bacterium]